MQLWPPWKEQTRKFCSRLGPGGSLRRGGWGGVRGAVCAVAAPLCCVGGGEHICRKLQEADEVLIC